MTRYLLAHGIVYELCAYGDLSYSQRYQLKCYLEMENNIRPHVRFELYRRPETGEAYIFLLPTVYMGGQTVDKMHYLGAP